MRIAILGCGPAGLLIAHAAWLNNVHFDVYSKPRKSEMFGAQYLHKSIPGLDNGEPAVIRYILKGTAERYRARVYDEMDVTVSPNIIPEMHLAWNIRHIYDQLWNAYSDAIIDFNWDMPNQVADILTGGYDEIFCTIPRTTVCGGDHKFASVDAWALGDAPERGVMCEPANFVPPNTVVCNGEEDGGWYRASNIFGMRTMEWPANRKPPLQSLGYFRKPIATDCSCFPKFHFAGRYGRWEKTELSHNGFERAMFMFGGGDGR